MESLVISASYQNLIAGHRREFQKIPKKDLEEDLARSSCKNFLWGPRMNFHTSTNAEHRQDLDVRTSREGFQHSSTGSPQDLVTRTCARSCKGLLRISPGSLPDPLKDLYKIMQGPCGGLQDHARACKISKRIHQDLYNISQNRKGPWARSSCQDP